MFRISSKMGIFRLISGLGSPRVYIILSILTSLAVSSQQEDSKLVAASTLPANQEDSQAQNYSATTSDGLSSTTSTSSTASRAQDLDINAVIKQFESSLKNRSVDELLTTVGLQREQLKRPQAQIKKLIRSRYRSRVANPADSFSLNSSSSSSNYSQPFDNSPISQQLASGRALSMATGTHQGSVISDSPAGYYVAAPSQRASVHAAATPTASNGNTAGVAGNGESGSTGLVLEEPSSFNQENLLDYTPPLQLNPSYAQSGPIGRMYSTGRSRGSAAYPYFMASPSMNSVGFADYYGSANGDHHPSSLEYLTDHYVPRSMVNNNNYSENHLNYEPSTGYSSSMQFPSTSEFTHSYSPSSSFMGRSRWSWPWTDVSGFGSGGFGSVLSSNPMTSATFKKHYHHHMPAHHKEHDHHHHHEEHHDDHLSKWEHGISIGEIACIAIAVVLGVIILGSPFFLLFLMLFNGGNLFGGTQMGLLAPAAAPGGGGGATGRRRRKRSVDNGGNKLAPGLSKEELEARLKDLDLHGVGEYLFERLSPFMDADKLMRSFEKIMAVKDDVESLVSKLGFNDVKGFKVLSNVRESSSEKSTNVDLRRRRKK